MFERLSDGLVGLLIFFSNWLSPGTNSEDIKIVAAHEFANRYSIQCMIKINWNEQMSDLIDAGIPLRFVINFFSDRGDSTTVLRTLQCDIVTYKYSFSDTIIQPPSDSVFSSKKYSQIYRALRNYCRWTCSFSKDASRFNMEAELQPSWVSHLNRSVDMSEICNCKIFSRTLIKKKD